MEVRIWKRFLRRWLGLLKGFRNVLVKELKELIRDPKIFLGMIIVPLIMFPVMGGIMSFSVQTAQEQAQKASVLVLNNDGGNYSWVFINDLSMFVKVYVENDTTPASALNESLLAKYNATQLLEIPQGFSGNVTEYVGGNRNVTAVMKLSSPFSGSGMFEEVGSSMFDVFVEGF